MPTADSLRRRKRFSHLKGGPAAAPRSEEAPGGAWLALHTALTLSAGHGLFLAAAVSRHGLPGLRDLGGAATAPFVLFFVASIPLTLASFALRNRYADLSHGWQRGIAGAAWVAVAAAFGGYLWRMFAG